MLLLFINSIICINIIYRIGISCLSIICIYPVIVSVFYLFGGAYYIFEPDGVMLSLNVPAAYYFLDDSILGCAVHSALMMVPIIYSNKKQMMFSLDRHSISRLINKYSFLLILISIIVIVISSLSFGINNIIERRVYQVEHSSLFRKSLQGLGESLSIIGPMMLGAVFYSSENKAKKFIVFSVFILYILYFIGSTTRLVAVAPLMFLFCKFIHDKPNFRDVLLLILVFCVSVFFLVIPLASRGMPSQGIIPSISIIMNIEKYFWMVGSIPENILSPVWISSITLLNNGGVGSLSPYYFFISVNPMPGIMTNWYDVSDHLRVNEYVPFNVVGELLSYGWIYLLCYSFVIGNVIYFISRKIDSLKSAAALTLVAGFIVLVSMLSLQYNLRSVTRQFYYIAVIVFLFFPVINIARRIKIKI
jgi:hypothetical protein